MSTKMLINAQRVGHVRVAIVEGTQLEDYQVETTEAGLTRGNIYRGTVANIQPSLNAAFVDIGEDRHAFLPVVDVVPAAYHKDPPEGERRPRIDQLLERGKPIFVQVTKDGLGQKGAALTTNLALAGRYLVLTPFDSVRGISRKAEGDEARKKARERLGRLKTVDGCGVIVRTNGLDQNQTTLNRDLNALTRLWKKVKDEGSRGRGPRLLYSDQDLIVQALRDYLDSSIEQVIVDNNDVFDKVENYMRAFMPRSKTKLIHYTERQPLFSRFNIEMQIDGIYERRASLPSGGSIVIDTTEALTAIDVNSGRATQASDHDEAIYNVNAEAAEEVGRQLRLRDIGGIVVIDFIDMRLRKHQRKLEKVMRDALKTDRARCAVGRISSNGLLEVNRQRIKQALRHRTHRPCPTCQGIGSIPSPEFAALNLLGRLEARASSGLMESVTVVLHPERADSLQNHHRRELTELQTEFELRIEVLSNPSFSRSQERIDWTHRENAPTRSAKERRAASAKTVTATEIADGPKERRPRKARAEAEDGGERSRRSRGRRRRRRNGKAEAEAPEAVAAVETAEDEPKVAAAADAEGDERSTRRTRRPSRRRPKSSEAEDATAEAAPAKRSTSSRRRPKSSEAEDGAAEAAPAKRSTSSRRRPKSSEAEDAETAPAKRSTSSRRRPKSSEAEDAETAPAKRSTSSRRRPKSSAAEDGAAAAAPAKRSTSSRRRPKSSEAEHGAAAPAKRSTSSRRRPKSSEAEDGAAADAPAKRSTSSRRRPKSSEAEDGAAADAPAKRSTSSRRRRPATSRTADEAPAEDAAPRSGRRSPGRRRAAEDEGGPASARPERKSEGEAAEPPGRRKPLRRRRYDRDGEPKPADEPAAATPPPESSPRYLPRTPLRRRVTPPEDPPARVPREAPAPPEVMATAPPGATMKPEPPRSQKPPRSEPPRSEPPRSEPPAPKTAGRGAAPSSSSAQDAGDKGRPLSRWLWWRKNPDGEGGGSED